MSPLPYVKNISIVDLELGISSEPFRHCRMDNEMQIDYEEFISRQRSMLQREGFRIKGVISSQMDTLRPCLGDHIFKLPYPILRHSTQGDDEKQK